MAKRVSNQLPNNLPQLQNLIKRDPVSYKEEFQQQYRHFQSTMEVFELSPDQFNQDLDELVMFLANVAKCYQEEMKEFPEQLVAALKKHSTVIDSDMRLSFCRSLILLRNKNLISPAEIHHLFFQLLRCQDKSLRIFLKDNIINDIKNINAKHKDIKLNSTLQNFMYSMLKDSHTIAAKTSLEVMISLYKKNVWKDEKTVNVMTTACFSKVTKIMVTALKFFLGNDDDEDEEDSDDDELPTVKETGLANRVNKKSKKRDRMLMNIKKAHRKKKKKDKAPQFNFSALHLIHNPQELAERLFKKTESLNEKFEVKLMLLELVSRLVGTHQLIVLNFYPYIARFIQPHQREVVRLLQFSAQACHEHVPPDAVEPVLKTIVNNFVTERNSAEVMAVGLNAVREICTRCPLVMTEDLLRDLTEYKSYKNKAVMMASKSLIQLFRTLNPELLHKKDRGKPTEARMAGLTGVTGKAFGSAQVLDYVPGAEVLNPVEEDQETTPTERGVKRKRGQEEEEEAESDADEWMDVDQSGSDEEDEEEGTYLTLEEKKAKAQEATIGRIFTDEDFRRIDAAQLKKQVSGIRKNKKRKPDLLAEPEELAMGREELVNLENIEMVHGKKKRRDKEARMESIMKGREGREKFGGGRQKISEFASTTNKEKARAKNFSMMKHKIKTKVRKSFREKQMALQKRLLKQQKFKV